MKIIDGFVVRQMGERAVAVAVSGKAQKFRGMISLNDTAKVMWETLSKGATAEEVAAKITEEYDVAAEVAKADADAFIAKLRAAGLIED